MAEATVDNQVPAKAGAAEMLKKPLMGLQFLENLAEMPVLRQVGLLVGLAASIAIGFGIELIGAGIAVKLAAQSIIGFARVKLRQNIAGGQHFYLAMPLPPRKG